MQTSERIYFITPFIKGGDLFHKLKNDMFLSEDLVKFYGAQIAIAIQHLHDLGFAYRDLKPENILIDEDGYLKLCDFGSTVHIQGNNLEYSYAGTERYVSPEMINGEGYNMLTDWWSFGILIYELLYGFTPFYNDNKIKMKQLITLSKIKFPNSYKDENGKEIPYKVSNEAKNIIIKFLNRNCNERLGSGNKGFENIKKDNFFGGMNFKELEEKKIKSPYIPEIDSNDLKNKNNINLNESKVEDWINDYKNEFDIFNDEYNNEEYNN
jgi:serine/threonine protein kinase